MKKAPIFIIILYSFILSGCPEEVGANRDTPVYLANQSGETKEVILLQDLAVDLTDSALSDSEIEFIYSRIDDPVILPDTDSLEWYRVSREDLEALGTKAFAQYNYVFSVDSLRKLTPEEVQSTHRGITKYFFQTLADYETVDFTMVYPKE